MSRRAQTDLVIGEAGTRLVRLHLGAGVRANGIPLLVRARLAVQAVATICCRLHAGRYAACSPGAPQPVHRLCCCREASKALPVYGGCTRSEFRTGLCQQPLRSVHLTQSWPAAGPTAQATPGAIGPGTPKRIVEHLAQAPTIGADSALQNLRQQDSSRPSAMAFLYSTPCHCMSKLGPDISGLTRAVVAARLGTVPWLLVCWAGGREAARSRMLPGP